MRFVIVIALCVASMGCSTMNFVNGPKMDETIVREQWHHLGINGLIEFSKPLNLSYNCGNQQWDSITIERSLLNGVAAASSAYLSLYTPWSIVYECREAID